MVSIRNNYPEILLFLAVTAFIFFKIPHLYLPLHWDELGVYGRSVIYLLEHGISIFPGDLTPELSRGHPMLLVFITSLFANLFSSEPIFYSRILMLSFGVGLLILTYLVGKKLFDGKTGAFASLLLLTQPIFIAQSTLILPEMLLALLSMLCLYAYINKKNVLYFIACSLALLTKESGIILPAAFILHSILHHRKIIFRKTLILATPVLVFLCFLIIQKVQNGWFFFPYHTDLINFDIGYIFEILFDVLVFLFYAQGRIILTIILIASIAFPILRPNHKKHLATTLSPALTLLIITLVFAIINFYMARYLLMAVPVLTLIFAAYFRKILPPVYFKILAPVVLIFPLFFLRDDNKFNYDIDMGYVDETMNIKACATYLESELQENDLILADFPLNIAISNKKWGYLEHKDSLNYTRNQDTTWTYLVITDPSANTIKIKDSTKISLIKTFNNRFATSRIYKRVE